jgi:GntR family transcriptional repressor for pyruvate dehydrogenase complex
MQEKKTESSSSALALILPFIKARRFEPGDRLPSEREFAKRFDMSRGAIREALATLEVMRVIERRPNSGIYLRHTDQESSFETLVLHNDLGLPLTREEIAQAFEVRRVLEIQAVILACERRKATDIALLRRILEDADARVAEGKTIEREDRDFHLAIVSSTRNVVLLRIVNAFFEMSQTRRHLYFSNIARCRVSCREHHEIFRALEKRDVVASTEALQDHLTGASEHWQIVLNSKP